ncbi:MAG: PepSY-like domain-containing protein [Chitinophagaceae bacterium]
MSFSQKVKQAEVPAGVKQAFQKQFPNSKEVKWEKEQNNFEVNFEQNHQEMSALFNTSGVIEETEVEIKKSMLPSMALTYISKNYKGAKIKEAAMITKADGEVNYEAEVKGMDIIFTKDGRYIKTVKE